MAALCHPWLPPSRWLCLGVSFSSSLDVHVQTGGWAAQPPHHPGCVPTRGPAWRQGWASLGTSTPLGTFTLLLTGAPHRRPACRAPRAGGHLGGPWSKAPGPGCSHACSLPRGPAGPALPVAFCRARPSWVSPGGHVLSPYPRGQQQLAPRLHPPSQQRCLWAELGSRPKKRDCMGPASGRLSAARCAGAGDASASAQQGYGEPGMSSGAETIRRGAAGLPGPAWQIPPPPRSDCWGCLCPLQG